VNVEAVMEGLGIDRDGDADGDEDENKAAAAKAMSHNGSRKFLDDHDED
jgi:hypothetical protein